MMQIKKENISPVTIKFVVTVPSKKIKEDTEKRIAVRAKTVKLAGFRKGHVPIDIVRKNYLEHETKNIIEGIVQETVKKTIKEEKLHPITTPLYTLDSFKQDEDLQFSFFVDLEPEIPTITEDEIKKLKIEKITCDVDKSEIETEYKKFCEEYKKPKIVKRAAKLSDFVVVNIAAVFANKPATELSSNSMTIILGHSNNEFLEAIEKKLIGMSAGEVCEVKIPLSKKFQVKKYAGKKIYVTLSLISVSELQKATFNEKEAKEIGYKDLAAVNTEIEKNLKSRNDYRLQLYHKRKVLDVLAEVYDFPVPHSIVEKDFQQVCETIKQEIAEARRVNDKDVIGKTDEEILQEYKKLSERRVRLGFIIKSIADSQKISLSEQQVQKALSKEISRYPGQEKEVLNFYKKNPQATNNLLAPILEDEVIDRILNLACLVEKKVSSEEFEKLAMEILPI